MRIRTTRALALLLILVAGAALELSAGADAARAAPCCSGCLPWFRTCMAACGSDLERQDVCEDAYLTCRLICSRSR
jgi:hypothetical protein